MDSWQEVLFRFSMASVFGALIGLERERKDWTAGMRTHMIVSLGSALIMMVSSFGFSDILSTDHVCSIHNKSASGLFIQMKFENMNAGKPVELLNNLQKNSEINNIYWNK